jgi:hypothetical protein
LKVKGKLRSRKWDIKRLGFARGHRARRWRKVEIILMSAPYEGGSIMIMARILNTYESIAKGWQLR